MTRQAVAVSVACLTIVAVILGPGVPGASSAPPFHAPRAPTYLRGLGRPSATGYNVGDRGIPYDCDFWKLGLGKVVVEYCVVDNHVGATLTQHRS
jgi:hypothetical protein